jgi:hypothetical protein
MGNFSKFYTLAPSVSLPAFGGEIQVRITEDARKCVVFFGVPGEGPIGGKIEYGGTGFLAGYEEGGLTFGQLATCRHVAKALQAHEDTGYFMRLNLFGGGSELISLGKIDWRFHPDRDVDLAVVPFAFLKGEYDHLFYTINIKWADRFAPRHIEVGDLLSIVGLFRPHAGTTKNVPIVHTGNVAVMADPLERVPIKKGETGGTTNAEVYLVQAPTLEGLSGAPAFVHQPVSLSFLRPFPGEMHSPKAIGGVALMGIYSGSWDGEPGKLLAADRGIDRTRRVPVGMGTVVPVDKLIELIREDDLLKKMRKHALDQQKAQDAANEDSAFPAPRASEENPKHREDFNILVDAAARKQKQGDQT